MAIFKKAPVGEDSTVASSAVLVASSGPYSDAISGVVIKRQIFEKGEYIIFPSTSRQGLEETKFTIYVHSFDTSIGISRTN